MKKQHTADQLEIIQAIQEGGPPERVASFTGWGALRPLFDENSCFSAERNQLKEMLTEEEYCQAMEASSTSFYTPVELAEAMEDKLVKMGFPGGNVLDPCCGSGVFLGADKLFGTFSDFTGCECDLISAKAASILYPDALIQAKPFEKCSFELESFDCIIANVPFSQYRVYDPKFDQYDLKIHDYFLAKCASLLRKGAVMAMIAPVSSLSSKEKSAASMRTLLADEGVHLCGAVRLPKGTFFGTETEADLMFLKKMLEKTKDASWIEGDYFEKNPEMILPQKTKDLIGCLKQRLSLIDDAFELDEEDLFIDTEGESAEIVEASSALSGEADGTYSLRDGVLVYTQCGKSTVSSLDGSVKSRIAGMVEIRKTACTLIERMADPLSKDEEIEALREELNTLYDAFTERYGALNLRVNKRAVKLDVMKAQIFSLEEEDLKTGEFHKTDIFYKRTIYPTLDAGNVSTPHEALVYCLYRLGRIDPDDMAKRLNMDSETIIRTLLAEGEIFIDPVQFTRCGLKLTPSCLVSRESYLSGNVRKKLRQVTDFLKTNDCYRPKFETNLNSLKGVIPDTLPLDLVQYNLSSPWIPIDVLEDFGDWIFQGYSAANVQLERNPYSKTIIVLQKSFRSGMARSSFNKYGCETYSALKVFEDCLNGKVTIVRKTMNNGEKKISVVDSEMTAVIQEKQKLLGEAFHDYVNQNASLKNQLEERYNELFNGTVRKSFDGSRMSFPMMNREITLRDFQKDTIARCILGGSCCAALPVGFGKTFVAVASIMEMKRMSLISKACMVVPKHLLKQTVSEAVRLYPGAKIIAPEDSDFSKKRSAVFLNRIAASSCDMVILTKEQFKKIPLSPKWQMDYLEREIGEIRQALKYTRSKLTVRNLNAKLKNATVKLQRTASQLQAQSEKMLYFEQLGFDFLAADEAHAYKNLGVVTCLENCAGIGTTGYDQARDMAMKCEYIESLHRKRTHNPDTEYGVLFLTGTPVSNSITELYVMQKMLIPKTLKDWGLDVFDAWRRAFTKVVANVEIKPEGTGFQIKNRLSRYINLPELFSLNGECMQFAPPETEAIKLPKAVREIIRTEPDDAVRDTMEEFASRGERIRSGIDPKLDNMLWVLNDGRNFSLDPRTLSLPEPEDSKVFRCAEKILEIYETSEDPLSTQLVFCDLATPGGKSPFCIYDALRDLLVEGGIPASEIAYAHDAKTDEARLNLFRKVNEGIVRVLIGSTAKCGTGANLQKHLTALHHLDVPYRPSDLEQREGRIIRQGNLNDSVRIISYVSGGTFDTFMAQTVETKSAFIQQIMSTGTSVEREAGSLDEVTLTYSELKGLSVGDPRIAKRISLENELKRKRVILSHEQREALRLKRMLSAVPEKIRLQKEIEQAILSDVETVRKDSRLILEGTEVKTFEEASDHLKTILDANLNIRSIDRLHIGKFRGLTLRLTREEGLSYRRLIEVSGNYQYTVAVSRRSSDETLRNLFLFAEPNDLPKEKSNLYKRLKRCRESVFELEEMEKDSKAQLDSMNFAPLEAEIKVLENRIHELTDEIEAGA